MSEAIIGLLVTAVIGTAGLAGLLGAAQQFTRTARLRAAVTKNAELAGVFAPGSPPSRACMLLARDASFELCARKSVTLPPAGLYFAFMAAVIAVLQALFLVARIWVITDTNSGTSSDFSVAKLDTMTAAEFVPPADGKLWLLATTTTAAYIVALMPWWRLRYERSQFVRRLRADDKMLARAERGDVRVLVQPWGLVEWVFGKIEAALDRVFTDKSVSRSPAPSAAVSPRPHDGKDRDPSAKG